MIKITLVLVILTSLTVAQTKDELHKEIEILKKEILALKISKESKKNLSSKKYRYSNHTFASYARTKLHTKKMKRLEN